MRTYTAVKARVTILSPRKRQVSGHLQLSKLMAFLQVRLFYSGPKKTLGTSLMRAQRPRRGGE